ncbi:MAG: hypothetical protein AAGD38_24345, partial [Acidobacteriota bacterium]
MRCNHRFVLTRFVLVLSLAFALTSTASAKPGDFVFDLGGERFDPLVTAPASLFANDWSTRTSPADTADLKLVQFNGPVRQAWLDDLRVRGAEPLQYIHPHGYIVWGTGSALEAPATAVRWQGDFLPAFRLLPQWRSLSTEPIRVGVLIVRQAGEESVVGELERLGASREGVRVLDDRFAHAVVTVQGGQLSELATVPGVYSVQP